MTDLPVWQDVKEYLLTRMPLIYVFLSGVGFSIQTLIVKVLSEDGFKGAFHCIACRGAIQMTLSAIVIYSSDERRKGVAPKLFGDTYFVRFMLFMRSFVGFLGIMFFFSSVELIPMGDATVLVMLSPFVASVLGFFVLGEPWRLPELCATVISLSGAIFVIKPPFLFGYTGEHTSRSDHDGSADNGSGAYIGIIFALCSACTAGAAYLFIRILGTTAKLPWAYVTFSHALAQFTLSIPASLVFGERILQPLTLKWVLLMITAGLVGGPSQILMTMGMQREKSATATAMRMSDVLFGFIWQTLFTADAVSWLSVVGALLVSSSIIIIVVYKQQQTSSSSSSSSQSTQSAQSVGHRSGGGDKNSTDALNQMELTKLGSMDVLGGYYQEEGEEDEEEDCADDDSELGMRSVHNMLQRQFTNMKYNRIGGGGGEGGSAGTGEDIYRMNHYGGGSNSRNSSGDEIESVDSLDNIDDINFFSASTPRAHAPRNTIATFMSTGFSTGFSPVSSPPRAQNRTSHPDHPDDDVAIDSSNMMGEAGRAADTTAVADLSITRLAASTLRQLITGSLLINGSSIDKHRGSHSVDDNNGTGSVSGIGASIGVPVVPRFTPTTTVYSALSNHQQDSSLDSSSIPEGYRNM